MKRKWGLRVGTLLSICYGWYFFVPLSVQQGVDIDSSHMWTLAWAHAGGLKWGTDILFTYGPLGWVRGGIWLPETTTLDVALSFLYYGLLGFLLWRLLLPKENPTAGSMILSLLLLPVWLTFAGAYDAAVFFVLLAGGYALLAEERLPGVVILLFALFCALNVFVKYTFTVTVGGLVLLLAAGSIPRPALRFPLGAIAIALPLVGALSGTGFQEFFHYVFFTWPLASGYAEAMSLWGPAAEWIAFLVILASASFVYGISCCQGRSLGKLLPGWVWLAAVCFFVWKLAFVRHDGHAVTGMAFLILLIVFYLGDRQSGERRWHCATVIALGFWLLAAVGATVLVLRHHEGPGFHQDRWSQHWASPLSSWVERVGAPFRREALEAEFAQRLEALKQSQPLPSAIHGAVDYYNAFTGIVLAHELDYRPRPVFQSYTAYTPWLIKQNRDHLLEGKAPATLLTDLAAIDRRVAMMADGLSWLEIFSSFQPVDRGERVIAWQRLPEDMKREIRLEPVMEGTATLGEKIHLPQSRGQLLWVEFELEKHTIGKMQGLLYKPSLLRLAVDTGEGMNWQRRIVPGMSRTGFLLSPVIESPDQLLLLLADSRIGQGLQHEVSAFQILERAYLLGNYRKQYRYRLYRLEVDGPPGESNPLVRAHVAGVETALGEFSDMRALPSSFLPEVLTTEDIGPHLLAHADCRFLVAAAGDVGVLEVEFGLYDGSWRSGRTNGAGFRITGVGPDGEAILFERILRPLEHGIDRGVQRIRFRAEGNYHAFIFETDPLENTDWDWCYWKALRFFPTENPLSQFQDYRHN